MVTATLDPTEHVKAEIKHINVLARRYNEIKNSLEAATDERTALKLFEDLKEADRIGATRAEKLREYIHTISSSDPQLGMALAIQVLQNLMDE